MGGKSYTDTSREDFHCGKYKKVDIVQKSREKRNSQIKSNQVYFNRKIFARPEDEFLFFCGATIIADK